MRVCTINLGSKADWRVRRALKRRARDADVITVQEAGDRERPLRAFCDATGWTLLREDGDGRGKVAVLLSPVNAAFAEVAGWGYVPCTDRTFVGAPGAGPEWISPKHVLAADLGDVTVATTHLVPSVQRPPFPGRTKRRELYRQHIAAIVEWAATVPSPIVLTGDFNATPDYPQMDPLREAGFRCHAVPSHGDRAIDHIWVRGCTADAVEALPFPSDHRMVAATITIPEVPAVTRGIYPAAVKKLIPPGANDPAITPRIAILHVDAGNAESLHDYFATRSGGIESHFHVRKDGVVEQYRNIFWQADANLKANDFAVSIETQGFGAGEWNAVQLTSIKRLLLWLNREASIPLVRCTAWDGKGVGYHIMFGAPGPWTPVAKSCPGRDRIKQFESLLVPWMKSRTSPTRVEKARALLAGALADAIDNGRTKRAAAIKAALNTLPRR